MTNVDTGVVLQARHALNALTTISWGMKQVSNNRFNKLSYLRVFVCNSCHAAHKTMIDSVVVFELIQLS